jgi:hypothetical protein
VSLALTLSTVHLSRFVETLRNHRQNFSRGAHIRRARLIQRLIQRLGHRLFDCSRRRPRKDHRARIEPQSCAPAVTRISLTLEKPSRDETMQNPGERKSLDALNGEHPLSDPFFDYDQDTWPDDRLNRLS